MVQLVSNKSTATHHICLTPSPPACPLFKAHGEQWNVAAWTAEGGGEGTLKSALFPGNHQAISYQSRPTAGERKWKGKRRKKQSKVEENKSQGK